MLYFEIASMLGECHWWSYKEK